MSPDGRSMCYLGARIMSVPTRWTGRVAAPVGPKSERILRDRKITVHRAHEHPTATGPTTVHATTVTHALELPSPSPWGSGATQTPTST